MKKCSNKDFQLCVLKNVYFNTNNSNRLPLKRNKLALVSVSQFGDPLGGHLGFRSEARGKTCPIRFIQLLDILNYYKIKPKVWDPHKSLDYRVYETK